MTTTEAEKTFKNQSPKVKKRIAELAQNPKALVWFEDDTSFETVKVFLS